MAHFRETKTLQLSCECYKTVFGLNGLNFSDFFELALDTRTHANHPFKLFVKSAKVNPYGLLTKCEVKMAGYWPSSFFACLWTETKSRSINSQKKNEANIQPS